MKLNTYSKYKNTGIEWLGQVPEYWDIKFLYYLTISFDFRRVGEAFMQGVAGLLFSSIRPSKTMP